MENKWELSPVKLHSMGDVFTSPFQKFHIWNFMFDVYKPFSPDEFTGKVYLKHMNFTCDAFV